MPQQNLNRFFVSIVLPSILAIGFFILSIFIVILPSFENNIMEVKKEMISELTNTAWSLLEEYHQEELNGNMQLDSARILAAERIRQIRYGDEYKDYFWIINMKPVMIMHPYRPELIGQDLNNYQDPHGKLLFVEATKIAREAGEGYINYMWQWKDDSTRIVPKLSFVKEFEPWNWVVGTGIYLEDVREEISVLKNRLLRIALFITLIISVILAFIIRQSLVIENKRKNAENKLRLSRQKYKSLVEASTEGTLMIQEGEIIFSNLKFSELSGCDLFEIRKLKFEDLFEISWSKLEESFEDPKKSVSFETRLLCKKAAGKEVVISASKIPYADQTGYVIVVKEISPKRHFEKENEFLSEELQTSLLLINQPVKNLAGSIRKCSTSTTIHEAASIMTRKKTGVLFISQDEDIIGFIDDDDLRNRVLAENLSPERPVVEIMTSPVVSISENAPLYEAYLKMRTKNVSHLLIQDANNRMSGVIGYDNLFEFQENALSLMIKELEKAENPVQIASIYKRLPVLISSLIESGVKTEAFTRIITLINDAVHKRIIELALEDTGEAPCNFAFMVMGSEGRKEQTLSTDQDNAILFEDPADKAAEQKAKSYFLSLAEKINKDLHSVGYHYCHGEFMARNPKWTQGLNEWKKQFSDWINNSNPNDILEASIFFDFRFIYGDISLIEGLRNHVHQTAKNKSVFFYHLAQSVLKFKPPLNIFGNIVSNDPEADELNLDIKKVLLPVISFLRLYALQEGIIETGSMERARQLHQKNIIEKEIYEDITHSFSFMTYLRLRSQVNSITQDEPPGNLINLNKLSRFEVSTLKKIFSGVSELQTKVSFDFKGTEA
jgi:PAS domain S-box-containing protein